MANRQYQEATETVFWRWQWRTETMNFSCSSSYSSGCNGRGEDIRQRAKAFGGERVREGKERGGREGGAVEEVSHSSGGGGCGAL